MPRREMGDRKKQYLSEALFNAIRCLELAASTDYVSCDKENWNRIVSYLYPRCPKLGPTPANDRLRSHVGSEDSWLCCKTVRKVFAASTWPDASTLAAIIDRAVEVIKKDKPILVGNHDLELLAQRLKEFLIQYRNHLAAIISQPLPTPCDYLLSMYPSIDDIKEHFGRHVARVSLDELQSYVALSLDYAQRLLPYAHSPLHEQVIGRFCLRLQSQLGIAERQSIGANRQDFRYMLSLIREDCFRTEFEMLEASFGEATGTLNVFFLDSGFADSGSNRAVWKEESARVQIVDLVRIFKERNPLLRCHRSLLLAYVSLSDYGDQQLRILASDIVFLLVNMVDVSVGSKKIAKRIIGNRVNCLIVDDGTVMTALEHHLAWFLAKVSTSNPEYTTVLDKHRLLLDEMAISGLNYECQQLAGDDAWSRASETEREEMVVNDLKQWMKRASDTENPDSPSDHLL